MYVYFITVDYSKVNFAGNTKGNHCIQGDLISVCKIIIIPLLYNLQNQSLIFGKYGMWNKDNPKSFRK